jgi:hypothetical protein
MHLRASLISVDVAQLIVSSTLQVLPLVVFVSRPASFSASVDRRERRPQLRLVLSEFFDHSLDQTFVREPLAGYSVNEAIESRQGMVLHIAFVETEGELIDIAAKMLRAGVVVDTNQAALQNCEHAFNPVRGDIIADIFASAMIDRFVAERKSLDAVISAGLVRVEHRTRFDVFGYCRLDGCLVSLADRHRDDLTAALPHSEHCGLADRSASGLEFFGLVFVLFDPADIGFINFDDAFEFGQVIAAAGFAKPMQHEPSRLLRDADLLGELHAGDALASGHKQVHRVNPLVEGNVAALEYRTSANREVFLALVAAVVTASTHRDPIAHAANRAPRSIRPKPPFKVSPRGFLVREHLEKLERRNGALGHGLTPDLWAEYAPENRGSQVYNSQT